MLHIGDESLPSEMTPQMQQLQRRMEVIETLLEDVLQRLDRMEKLLKLKHEKKPKARGREMPCELPALTRSRSLSAPRCGNAFRD